VARKTAQQLRKADHPDGAWVEAWIEALSVGPYGHDYRVAIDAWLVSHPPFVPGSVNPEEPVLMESSARTRTTLSASRGTVTAERAMVARRLCSLRQQLGNSRTQSQRVVRCRLVFD
jgi:hypothetical protein